LPDQDGKWHVFYVRTGFALAALNTSSFQEAPSDPGDSGFLASTEPQVKNGLTKGDYFLTIIL
jgi:hypothetical protein